MRIRASHIQLTSEQSANEVLRMLNQGHGFEQLAKEYSQCPTSRQGGSLGEFGPGHMPELDDVFLHGEIGTLYGPIASSHGYHLIKVISRRD